MRDEMTNSSSRRHLCFPALMALLVLPANLQLATGQEKSSDQVDSGPASAGEYAPLQNAYSKYSHSSAYLPDGTAYDPNAFSDEPATERYRSERRGWQPTYQADGAYRKPAGLMRLDGSRFLISTQLSGQLFLLNAKDRSVQTIDMPNAPESETYHFGAVLQIKAEENGIVVIACTDQQMVRLFQVETREDSPRAVLIASLPCPGGSAHLAFDSRRNQLFASGRWSRQLFGWTLARDDLSLAKTVKCNLSVNGGQILLLPESAALHRRMLVADAFGSGIEVVDLEAMRVVKTHRLFDHNFQAMRLSLDENNVLLACQNLSDFIPAVRGEITWGGMLSNNVRQLPLANLLQRVGDDVYQNGKFVSVGFAGNGAGTPTDLALGKDGTLAVTMGGSSQLAVRYPGEVDFKFYDTGLHPVRVEFSSDQQELIVLNRFSDSLTFVPLHTGSKPVHVMLGPLRAPSRVELGELKFHDSRLSHDGWLSCASCHIDGHTSGLLNDNLTDHSQGTAKRILSLLGSRDTAPYSWFGEQEALVRQVAHSIKSTMASDHPVMDTDVEAIAAFIRTLEVPPSVSAARGEVQVGVAAGREHFVKLGCANCHSGALLTSPESYDVGLVDEDGSSLFNPPSLRGVSQRERALLHDGRAHGLVDLLESHQHQLPEPLEAEELAELVAYLRSL